MKQLHANNENDVSEMLKKGFKYVLRNTMGDDMKVISRHKTYEMAVKAASDIHTIVDLEMVETHTRENKEICGFQ